MNTENDSNIFVIDGIIYDAMEKFVSNFKNNKACIIDNISNVVLKNKDIRHVSLGPYFCTSYDIS